MFDCECHEVRANFSIDEVIDAMKERSDSPRLMEGVCHVIKHLVEVEEYKQEFIEKSGVELMMTVLNTHVNIAGIHHHGSEALSFLADFNRENSTKIMACGGVERLLYDMAKFVNDHMIIRFCIKTLVDITYVNDGRSKIIENGGLGCIITAMTMHSDVESVQTVAGLLLMKLSMEHSCIDRMISYGCIERAVKVMHDHQSSYFVNQVLLKMLCNVIHSHGSCKRIVDSGGIVCVVNALSKSHDDVDVVRDAVHVISHLTEEHADQVVDNDDVIRDILSVMTRHVTDSCVQHFGCAALSNIVHHDETCDDLFDEMVDNDVIPTVLAAMSHHINNEDVQRSACKLLADVAIGNGTECVSHGVIEQTITAMMTLRDDPNVALHACLTLAHIVDCDCIDRIIACGGVECVVDALVEFDVDVDVIDAALAAVNNMCVSSESARYKFLALGCDKHVRCAMAQYPSLSYSPALSRLTAGNKKRESIDEQTQSVRKSPRVE